MDKNLHKKLSALDPKFKKQIEELFERMSESVSLLYEAATHDEKTGLYNSKFFDTMIDMEMEKAQRGNEKLSLFIIDIDFFKKINDTYGHIKADEILFQIAKILQKTMRRSDIVSRFGGEEFFILLPETDLSKAKKLTSRLRSNLKNDKMLKKYSVTVSGGLTQYRPRDNKKKFMKRADGALYKAKHSGRDKFVAI